MLTFHVNKGSVAEYSATLLDQDGVAVPAASVTAAELWLYDVLTKRVINSRGTMRGSGQNVLNTNNVTIDAAGLFTWALQAADNPVVNDGLDTEEHRAVFRVTWGSPSKYATHEIGLDVINLRPLR